MGQRNKDFDPDVMVLRPIAWSVTTADGGRHGAIYEEGGLVGRSSYRAESWYKTTYHDDIETAKAWILGDNQRADSRGA